MKSEQVPQINIADPVTIGDHKSCIVEPRLEALHTPAGKCIRSGIDQMNYPVFAFTGVRLDFAICKIQTDASAQIMIVKKVALDFFTLITESDEKLVQTIMGEMLHDVP